ncbi:MAG: isoprenylcysteine carboxylmethyltransferase family protein [Candidatus Zixiibacteriota bacterium]|nr:MAG: isoprenylcysteine carboxylmethyltransferase family protein [candidate division Zixibacteria bacterium]
MNVVAKIAILVITGSGLTFLTRRALKGFHTHGLYRLCAWIASIALILLNLEVWFANPFDVHQVASWALLVLCVFSVLYGYGSLLKGRPDDSRNDKSLIGVERTTVLVEVGAYRYVRHPIYSSFIFGAPGVFLKEASWAGGVLTGIIIVCTVLAAKTEETENILYFGEAYRDYMERTKMFIPFLL